MQERQLALKECSFMLELLKTQEVSEHYKTSQLLNRGSLWQHGDGLHGVREKERDYNQSCHCGIQLGGTLDQPY